MIRRLITTAVAATLALPLMAEPSLMKELEDLKKSTGRKVVPVAPVLEKVTVHPETLETSIRRGVDYLVESQNADGSWGGIRRSKGLNIYCPIPGGHHAFKMGSSALSLMGLLESRDGRPVVQASIAKAEAWMLKALPRLKRAEETTTYNNWGHAYGLRALCLLAQREGVSEEKKALYKKHAEEQVKRLHVYQDVDGGWGYLHFNIATHRPSGGSMCFTTSTVLLALHQAKEVFGIDFPEARKKAAVRSVLQQRTPDFCYVYAMEHRFYTRKPINRPGGSLARTQVCNAAMRAFGDKKVTDEIIVQWLDKLVKRNGWLDIGRKRPRPHETHFAVSGYFYFYGHYYATEGMTMLPEAAQTEWKHKLATILMDKQEKDGSWWDYPLYDYHQAYGTGYTLVALARCRVK